MAGTSLFLNLARGAKVLVLLLFLSWILQTSIHFTVRMLGLAAEVVQ